MYSEIPSASPLLYVYILRGWSGLLRRRRGLAGFDPAVCEFSRLPKEQTQPWSKGTSLLLSWCKRSCMGLHHDCNERVASDPPVNPCASRWTGRILFCKVRDRINPTGLNWFVTQSCLIWLQEKQGPWSFDLVPVQHQESDLCRSHNRVQTTRKTSPCSGFFTEPNKPHLISYIICCSNLCQK